MGSPVLGVGSQLGGWDSSQFLDPILESHDPPVPVGGCQLRHTSTREARGETGVGLWGYAYN
jgi:hypothetical protein